MMNSHMALRPVPRDFAKEIGRPALHGPGATRELRVHELQFRPLSTLAEVARIQDLRAQIRLPACTLADPGFHAREKKETRRGWWALSSGVTRSSAP